MRVRGAWQRCAITRIKRCKIVIGYGCLPYTGDPVEEAKLCAISCSEPKMSSYRIYHSMFALGPRRLRWTTVRVGSFHGQALYHASSSTLSVPQRLIFNKTPQILKVPFHTSSPRPAPQFLLFFAPVSRFLVAIGARLTRSWWSRLTPERREAIKASLRKNRRYFYSVLGVITLFGAGFYVTHIEEAPLTHRRRFIMFPRKKVLSIIEKEKESIAEMFKQHFLSHNHPAYKRVHEIVSRILTANDTPEFQGFNWGLYVIDNPDVVNALCLPTGDIFVYTGLINQCKNDEELAFILSHEIAHAVLDHGMENLSRSGIINFLQLFLIAIIWAVVPNDLVSYFMHRTSGTTVQVLLEYPYSRKLETEADKVSTSH